MSSIKPPLPVLATPDDTEQQFYEALQSGDLERLMAVWADDEEVMCVHPGGPRAVGLAAVRDSFGKVLAQGPLETHPEQVNRMQHADLAVHGVLERVGVMTDQGPASAWVWATNVYVKTTLGWKMVAHHASPGPQGHSPPPHDSGNTLH